MPSSSRRTRWRGGSASIARLGERIRVIAGAAPQGFAVPDRRGRPPARARSAGGVRAARRAGRRRPTPSPSASPRSATRGVDLPVVVIGAGEGEEPAIADLAAAAGIPERNLHVRGALAKRRPGRRLRRRRGVRRTGRSARPSRGGCSKPSPSVCRSSRHPRPSTTRSSSTEASSSTRMVDALARRPRAGPRLDGVRRPARRARRGPRARLLVARVGGPRVAAARRAVRDGTNPSRAGQTLCSVEGHGNDLGEPRMLPVLVGQFGVGQRDRPRDVGVSSARFRNVYCSGVLLQ